MTNAYALKQVATALGAAAPGGDNADLIKMIADQIGATGGLLPAVDETDEGKILAVNEEGVWAPADAPPGGGPFTLTYESQEYKSGDTISDEDINVLLTLPQVNQVVMLKAEIIETGEIVYGPVQQRTETTFMGTTSVAFTKSTSAGLTQSGTFSLTYNASTKAIGTCSASSTSTTTGQPAKIKIQKYTIS